MRFFTGQYDRTVDVKNRIQLPSQLRRAIDPEHDGAGLYVVLGESRGTLAIYTERGFEELAEGIRTEFMSGPEARRFELQFYALASYVDMDKQGRLVLPERLRGKARLGEELAKKCQAVLDDRVRAINKVFGDRKKKIKGDIGKFIDGWPERSGTLYATAAEVAKKLGLGRE